MAPDLRLQGRHSQPGEGWGWLVPCLSHPGGAEGGLLPITRETGGARRLVLSVMFGLAGHLAHQGPCLGHCCGQMSTSALGTTHAASSLSLWLRPHLWLCSAASSRGP